MAMRATNHTRTSISENRGTQPRAWLTLRNYQLAMYIWSRIRRTSKVATWRMRIRKEQEDLTNMVRCVLIKYFKLTFICVLKLANWVTIAKSVLKYYKIALAMHVDNKNR